MADWSVARRASDSRPDISHRRLVRAAAGLAALAVLVLVIPVAGRPGEALAQGLALCGTVLLLLPLGFSLKKRRGKEASPPKWFVLHVGAASLGLVFILAHVQSGSILSPAGIPLVALILLVVQGFWARIVLPRRLAGLFAGSPASLRYAAPINVDREALRQLIDEKVTLLQELDPDAAEATFTVRLAHWCRSPWLSLRYQRLADREASLVGAKSRAGPVLSFWRRSHMLLAVVFYGGVLAHVIVMLFFAGYAADGGSPYWWHLAAWGGK